MVFADNLFSFVTSADFVVYICYQFADIIEYNKKMHQI